MINPEFKQGWVALLRGGTFPQAAAQLRTAFGYCCLGVACDLSNPDGWTRDDDGFYRFDGEAAMIPAKLRDEIGLSVDDAVELAMMNDDGASFARIADYIEEHH